MLFLAAVGCQPAATETKLERKPRPVEVSLLTVSKQSGTTMVSAPVASWKTEQIGMEVGGRIEWVVEPNTDIEGRVVDGEGNLIIEGTPIARIDDERMQLQVQSQRSQVERATQAIAGAKIQIEKTLPAQIRAAQAEKKRAQTEYERSKRLVAQKAGAQSDVDRDEAALSTATSQIEQLNANVKAQLAELASLEAQLLQAEDALRDAQRNVEDCTLYSSFRGQIAEVSVVPGSVVTAGQAVATIQMMDPIKVEVEVSAEDSRRLRNRQRIPLLVTREDGTEEEQDGFLYLVDPVADPQTRTFTLTLLVMNQRLSDELAQPDIPTTDQTWRMDFPFLPNAENGAIYASQDAIYEDETGHYVWRVDNMQIHGDVPENRILKVVKMPVELAEAQVPFLGNWIFQQIRILDSTIDPGQTLISGKLLVPDGKWEDWDGGEVLFQNDGQWMLRPGDLVRVDLSNNTRLSGLFVPMDAIAYEDEKTFLFLLSESGSTVERVEVNALLNARQTSVMVAVSPADASVSIEGRQYVSRGAHFLQDGEAVRAIENGAVENGAVEIGQRINGQSEARQ